MLKVCGMRDAMNIREAAQLMPDFMGFIFYPASPRYVGQENISDRLKSLPGKIKKAGVFVDENPGSLVSIMNINDLDIVQLHGNESQGYCELLKKEGLVIMKSIRVGKEFDFRDMAPFIGVADYFLFDTKGTTYGGTGVPFEWEVLNDYPYEVPFFLSGGVGIENIDGVKRLRSKQLMAIDVNSRIESAPGIKDIEKLKILQARLKGQLS
ncbi:MAG TPA: phosphoribosylanthranilate isomerase [Cyclobacteriaceae bacterium]|nr:phosphoribosylanthranilate isomerase [Cyclobacteriaceae bacterium]